MRMEGLFFMIMLLIFGCYVLRRLGIEEPKPLAKIKYTKRKIISLRRDPFWQKCGHKNAIFASDLFIGHKQCVRCAKFEQILINGSMDIVDILILWNELGAGKK